MQATHPLPSTRAVVFERALALFLVLHAIAHLVGTQASLAAAGDGKTLEYLGGAWAVSDPTVLRLLGVAWAVGVALFLISARALWVGSSRRVGLLLLATVYSLILSVLALWASVVGVVIDVALLIVAWRLSVSDRRVTR
jgi:hypothetical protein